MMFPVDRPPMESVALPDDYRPTQNDCLLGRGKKNWNHKGNALFRGLVRENVKAYQEAPDKQARNAIVFAIVDEIRRRGGRFLKQDDNKKWFDIGDYQAREKVGHSLRDHCNALAKAASSHRQEQTQEGQGTEEDLSEGFEVSPRAKRDSPSANELFSSPKRAKQEPAQSSFQRGPLQRSISLPAAPTNAPAPFSAMALDHQAVPNFASMRHSSLELADPSTAAAAAMAAQQAFAGAAFPSQMQQIQYPGQQQPFIPDTSLPTSPDFSFGITRPPSFAPHVLTPAPASLGSNWSLESTRTPEQGRAHYPNFHMPLDASMEPTPLAPHVSATATSEGKEDSAFKETEEESAKKPAATSFPPGPPPFS